MKPFKQVWLNFIQLIILIIFSNTVVGQQLKANFSADITKGCPPMVVTFTDQSQGNPVTWKWDLGNGTISTKQNPTATYFDPGVYTVSLIVTNQNGTIDSLIRTKFVTVNALPVVNFSASKTTGCFPLNVQFRDSSMAGSGTITAWQWDFGDGSLSTLQNPTHFYTGPGNFSVTLKVTNSNGCVKVFTKPSYIFLQNGARADFSLISSSGCHAPATVSFNNQSVGTGALTYKWDFGDGTTSTQVSPSHIYQNGGSYTIQLITTNSNGCSDTLTKPNGLSVGFVSVSFSKPAVGCVAQNITFSNTSNPSPVSSAWTFGDGTTSTVRSPQKAYTTPGTYQVKLVSDFGGCADSSTQSITISDKPKASFTASNNLACNAPLTAAFSSTSTNAVSYVWNFGDGGTSNQQNPTHTYTVGGSYTVSLVAINSSGCTDTLVDSSRVKIIPPNIAKIDGIGLGCLPFTITPTAVVDVSEPVTTYFWDFGDGSTSTSANPSHTYTKPGNYNIFLRIRTASGCTDTITISQGVKVGRKGTAAFTATPLDVCAELPITFTDQSISYNGPDSVNTAINEWLWNFGDGGTSTLQNPIHKYTDTGRFSVMLIVTNNGCSDTLLKRSYIHITPPIASFDTSYVCTDRLTRKFIDKSLGATSWNWDFGDGNTSTVSNPSHTYAQGGKYTVKLTVSNGVCQHSTKRLVWVIKENGRLTITDTAACKNTRIVFGIANVTPTNLLSYSWYFSGLSAGNPLLTFNSPVAISYANSGVMPVAVIVQDSLNCKDTIQSTTPVKVYGPKAVFASPFPGTCFKNAVNFIDSSTSDGFHPITKWVWNYGDSVIQNYTAPPFVHSYNGTGVFGVGLTITDSYGCKDSLFKPTLITISNPVVRFHIRDTLLCPSVPLDIQNLSTGYNGVYNWDFGDGNTSIAKTPVYDYKQEGTYLVSLKIADQYGCRDTMVQQVNVFKASAAFTMSDSFSSCPPLMVNFVSANNYFTSHSYDFGDGGKSTLLNPSHLYTYPGTYFVKRWAFNTGGCTDTVVQKVVIQGPTGSFTYDPLQVCNPSTINFVANTQNSVQYIWDYNDGNTNFNTLTSTSHTYTTPGKYVPKMILEDASGCRVPIVGPDTIKVTGVETYLRAINTTLCDSGFVNFSDSSLTNDVIASYAWDFGDGNTSTLKNPSHKYTATGLYNVNLTVQTSTQCPASASMLNYIKVVNSPAIAITGDTSVCVPANITYQGTIVRTDTSALSWSWNLGNNQTSTLQNPSTQIYTVPGAYNIRAVATNVDGCADTSNLVLNVRPIPVVNAGPDTLICRYQTITLQPSGATNYTWTFDKSLSCLNCASPVAKPDSATTYYVTGTSLYGCKNSDSLTVLVKQPLQMSVQTGDTLCAGETLMLTAAGAAKYQWSPPLYLNNTTIANPVTNASSSIRYQVIGRDDKNCFADTGYVDVKVYPIPQISIKGDSIRSMQVGSTMLLETISSPDVTKWKWSPATALSCTTCPSPTSNSYQKVTYTVVASNDGTCIARDEITLMVICNNANIYVPNTFSPNGDGANDVFYPRGRGIFGVRSFKIFNRWGQIVFERGAISANDASQGWDGIFKGVKLTSDVYVYLMEVICENGAVFPMKGNVTLLR